MMPRPPHLAPEKGDGDDDWPERWGRRIGAVLGPALLALAALWLAWHLFAQQPPA